VERSDLTQEILAELLEYDMDSGRLWWKKRADKWFPCQRICNSWNTRYAGKETFTNVHPEGYYIGHVLRVPIPKHIVIWILLYGERAKGVIDHIDGDRKNNHPSNLRDVSHQENCKNQSKPKSNTSGVCGVSWKKASRKWTAGIRVDGRRLHLGYFEDFSDAVEARRLAEAKHGFHTNHGRPQ
jgi:hypothetical protein